jgi:hypothetical protein
MFMRFTLQRPNAAALVAFLALACSADSVDLGTVPAPPEGSGSGRCALSSVLEGSVLVTDQAGLDELAGCEEITGNLEIAPVEGASLAPLASLRRVGGTLELGSVSWLLAGPELSSDDIAEAERYGELVQRGWLDSLEGLEKLQSVAGLALLGVSAPDLHALRALENIGPSEWYGTVSGSLVVASAQNLRDLSGLENARGIGRIEVRGTQLESLDGLNVGDSAQSIALVASPRLRDIDALGSIATTGAVTIEETGIESLEGLAAWRGTDQLTLWDNPALVDVSRIGQLHFVGTINMKNNDALTSLPSLASFETLDAIFIVDNNGLEELDLDLVNAYPRGFLDVGTFSRGFRFPTQRVEVQGNSNLRRLRLAGSHGLADIQFLTVTDNPALTQIDFPHLAKVDWLIVNSNATLSSVGIPALKTVDTLEVLNNPALSEATFDHVKTFEILMSGNAAP